MYVSQWYDIDLPLESHDGLDTSVVVQCSLTLEYEVLFVFKWCEEDTHSDDPLCLDVGVSLNKQLLFFFTVFKNIIRMTRDRTIEIMTQGGRLDPSRTDLPQLREYL